MNGPVGYISGRSIEGEVILRDFPGRVILLILCCLPLWSADLNTTLIDADPSYYKKLLGMVKSRKHSSPEDALAQTLLSMLSTPQKHPYRQSIEDQNLSIPKDTTAYKALFGKYIDDTVRISVLQEKLALSENKVAAIEKEIKSLDNNDTRLLSFELQDAFYHRNRAALQQQIAHYRKEMQQIASVLQNGPRHIAVDSSRVMDALTKEQQQAVSLRNRLSKLAVDKEQARLLSQTKKITRIEKEIDRVRKQYDAKIRDIAGLKFLLFVSSLQHKDDHAFALAKEIKSELSKLHEMQNVDMAIMPLFSSMEQAYLGRLKTIAGSGKQELMEMVHEGWKFANRPIFTINKTPVSLFKLVITLLIFIMGFVLGALYKRKIHKLAANKRSFTASTRTLLANLGYYLIIVIAFFTALNVLGIKLSSLALFAGALSVGIGFGLQNIVSNFVSGLILMFERTIKIGDYVQLENDIRGYVTDIRMRSTTINTNENIDIIVPNQSFIEHDVINWTMNDRIRRFEIPFGVKYGTDPHRVIEIVKKAVAESGFGDIYTSSRRKTRVLMTEMGDSSVNFELFVWIQGEEMHYPKRTRSRFLILIYDALNANGIEIPFPQRDLHIRSIDPELIQTIQKGDPS